MIYSVNEATSYCHTVLKLPELVQSNPDFQIDCEAETIKTKKD